MELLTNANHLINKFAESIQNNIKPQKGQKLYTGIDLGTAYIVLAVVDENNLPVSGALEFAQVVKDGLVVDYIGAVDIVKKLKAQIEKRINCELVTAGVSYPPGTMQGDQKTVKYVAEAAGFEVVSMIDEPTAANNVLKISDGAIVDIGGGTTGIAIFKDGEVVYVGDEATGGTHFSLVIAGAYNIPFTKAEEIKKDLKRHKELFPIVKPVIQKVAAIIDKHIAGHEINTIYLVGGTSCFDGIDKLIEKELGIPVIRPDNPLLVTPLGIALNIRNK